ncbi:hypothetical protein KP509_17G030100 [Ceratopteris richardii]|uniref:CASP-like protein n=1 Tax=Ceratopteris richardii TaxID=49495 RepID=A0A8T2SX08_CERRI|nr:hypothetical protein KP509_17G030100 [Ceratopteris richardii]
MQKNSGGSVSPSGAMGVEATVTHSESETKGRVGMKTQAMPPCDKRVQSGTRIGRLRILDIVLRSAVIGFAAVSLCAMFTSTQHSEVHVFGFRIGISLRWNRSKPFMFLVVVDLLVCAYALLHFVYQSVIYIRKEPLLQKRMLLQLASDQACTYMVLAAAAAAGGASRTNKSAFQTLGVESVHISGVCTVLDKFCSHATIAFTFTLLAAFASAASTALDVLFLTLSF